MGESARRKTIGLPPQSPKINPAELEDRTCECGGMFFTDALRLKEVPAMLSPSGIPETMIFKVGFICVSCGKVIPLRPEETKPEPKIELAKG
jgi:hypothetical protein